jgi:hypothetical protein
MNRATMTTEPTILAMPLLLMKTVELPVIQLTTEMILTDL